MAFILLFMDYLTMSSKFIHFIKKIFRAAMICSLMAETQLCNNRKHIEIAPKIKTIGFNLEFSYSKYNKILLSVPSKTFVHVHKYPSKDYIISKEMEFSNNIQ